MGQIKILIYSIFLISPLLGSLDILIPQPVFLNPQGALSLKHSPRTPSSISSNTASNYTQDIEQEKSQSYVEVYLQFNPLKELSLKDYIFNKELSKEFILRYQDQFKPQFEPLITNYNDISTAYNSSAILLTNQKKEFAEYMIKRLVEWHLDHYIQSDPAMKTIYEVKEKLQKIEVKVTKQTKLNMKYSLASNIFDFIVETPYLDEARLTLRMDPKSFGPNSLQSTTLFLTKKISKKNSVQFNWEQTTEVQSINWLKQIPEYKIHTYYGLSVANQKTTLNSDLTRANIGMGWQF